MKTPKRLFLFCHFILKIPGCNSVSWAPGLGAGIKRSCWPQIRLKMCGKINKSCSDLWAAVATAWLRSGGRVRTEGKTELVFRFQNSEWPLFHFPHPLKLDSISTIFNLSSPFSNIFWPWQHPDGSRRPSWRLTATGWGTLLGLRGLIRLELIPTTWFADIEEIPRNPYGTHNVPH